MIDTSNGPVGQVQAEIWLFKKKLDFQKNVKVHILKKANYIEVLRLFYLQKQVFLVNLVQILWIYEKKIKKKYWPCVHYFLTPYRYHIEKMTKNGLIKPSRSWQIESFIPSGPWIHLKAKKNWIFKNWYHLVQNIIKKRLNNIFEILSISWYKP